MTQRQQTGFLKDIVGVYIPKDPNASLQYGIDWTDWLSVSETVTTSTFAVETTGTGLVTLTNPIILDNVTAVTITGGTTGTIYTIANTITTSESWRDVRRFRVKVDKRFL